MKTLKTTFALLTLAASCCWGATLATIWSFNGTNGSQPTLTELTASGTTGVFYGTTLTGGAYGGGTVFQVTDDGAGNYTETVLHSFDGTNGNGPAGPLTVDSSGNIYGTTTGWYWYTFLYADPGGSVFQLHPDGSGGWVFTNRNFVTTASPGYSPRTVKLLITGSYAYGATFYGGAHTWGTLWRALTPQNNGGAWGTPSVLHSFAGGSDGASGNGGLVLDSSGTLYGTTANDTSGTNYGVLYSYNSSGYTVLHQFGGPPSDGSFPTFDLLLAGGSLYGVTTNGGANDNGTVYQWNLSAGTETILHSFANTNDGYSPSGGLALDSYGRLFGVTGQIGGCGLVYYVTSGGGDSIVANVTGGCNPFGTLLGQGGAFYGLASTGGSHSDGSVFKVTP